MKRWNRLQTARRDELKIALTLYCFPPNKGNIGTAADLDVIPSLCEILRQLKNEGYSVDIPEGPDALARMSAGGVQAPLVPAPAPWYQNQLPLSHTT